MKRKTKQSKHASDSVVDQEIKEVKREWRNLIKFSDENKLLFAAFVIVMTALVVINSFYIIVRAKDDNNRTPTIVLANPNKILTSLQTGQNSAIKVTIDNVTESDKTDYAFPISSDSTFLIMDISITNETEQIQKLIPVNQLYVRSNEGDYSPMHPSMYIKNPLATADLMPLQTVKGEISFEVPKRVASPLLYVDTTWNNYAPIVFDVLH